MKFIYLALGGSLGAITRYLLAGLVYKCLGPQLPWGTFVVNILGCLGIGIFLELNSTRFMLSQELKLFFVTGFFGAFTTFSALIVEGMNLTEEGFFYKALLYIVLSVVVGFLALRAGIWLARSF